MARFSDQRVAAILAGKRDFGIYPFPGLEGVEVAIRVLTDYELDQCRLAAQKWVRDQCKRRGWKTEAAVEVDPQLLDRAIERELLWWACYDSETVSDDEPVRFFEKSLDVGKLDQTQIAALTSAYIERQQWTTPLLQADDEEVDELIEALGKAQVPEVFLGRYAPSTLSRLLITLASRLRSET